VPYPNHLSTDLTQHPAAAGFFIAFLPAAGGSSLLATLNFPSTEPPMPKNEVTDPITGQEIAFAHLVLSGTMTDRRAAETVGLHPDSAAYTKSTPRVHAYLQEHQPAPQQEPVAAGPRPFNPSREQILARLWEIGTMNPEITRGSLCGQVKALSMIVAIEGLIPDRRAASARNKPAPPPVDADVYEAEWLRNQRSGKNVDPEPTPPPTPEETTSEPSSAHDSPPPTAEPTPAPASAVSQHRYAPGNATPTPSLAPRVPMADRFAPDTRVPLSIKKNPFGRRR
jgi:hypothetical protein